MDLLICGVSLRENSSKPNVQGVYFHYWRLGSGWTRIEAEVNKDFRFVNAALASLVQMKVLKTDVRLVSGATTLF